MEEERDKMTGLQSDLDTAAQGAEEAQRVPGAEDAQRAQGAEDVPEREMSIEETLDELESLIEKMEDRSSSLEETFACYERGMKLVKECSGKIDRVEKKLMILTEDGQNDEL